MEELLRGMITGPMAVRTSEGIAHTIRKAILGGALPPGKPLPERQLADELNVSRTPVREALFTLQGEGLVDLEPGRCGRVRAVLLSEIEQIYALRRVLESFSSRCAAEHQDAVRLSRIEDALAAQRRLGSSAAAAEQAKADLAFHEAIAAAAGSRLLLTVMRQVLAVTVAHRSGYRYSSAHANRVHAQHGAILNAIKTGDAGRAGTLMAEHISESSLLALKHLNRAAIAAEPASPEVNGSRTKVGTTKKRHSNRSPARGR
jgi:DNA-binding GntR family transcriptional regulator